MQQSDEMLKSLSRLLFWIGCVIVAVLALLPKEQVPIILDFWDKAQHVAAFFVLGVLGLLVYFGRKVRVLLGLSMFGACIELLQWIGGVRTGSPGDWVADLAGLAIAYGCAMQMMSFPRLRRIFFTKPLISGD
jgi:VanZ family protein